ncbi:COG4705 family protein [Quadrisphaera oryzae]|uniref:COG4705 family protein n=1 Tax=Quadrisphaera TaxID=317661 RepID=UPI001647AC43|nr:hypothetical protein [Quadrisphaera sp. RL12-1S]MBC3763483.1 hypothetical protein [Quadrisphaera sp. RL12-1S]
MSPSSPSALRSDASTGRALLNKVPEVTVWFWIIKILCTTVGESFADWIDMTLGVGLLATAALFTVVLAGVLAWQFRTRQYRPTPYWLTVVLVSVTGTLYTDILTDQLQVPLWISSAVFAVLLAVVFRVWYVREGTLSIHAIDSRPREGFYWLTVLVTFALGTAVGDWFLELTGWSPGASALLPVALIAVVLIGWRAGGDAVLAFWLAYVLTRPLGANLGDFLAGAPADGGLGLGTLWTSLVFLATIAAVVAYLTVSRVDVATPASTATPSTRRSATRQRVVLVGWCLAAAATAGVLVVANSHRPAAAAASEESDGGSAPAVSSGGQVQGTVQLTAADTAAFRQTAQAMQSAVTSGQQATALSQARQLEKGWDDAQPTLQAKDPQGWTVVDGRIDAVLKAVRASTPEPAREGQALTQLLQVLPA